MPFISRHDDDEEEEMADNFIEFDAAGGGAGGLGHVKDLPEIITPQPIDDDLVNCKIQIKVNPTA